MKKKKISPRFIDHPNSGDASTNKKSHNKIAFCIIHLPYRVGTEPDRVIVELGGNDEGPKHEVGRVGVLQVHLLRHTRDVRKHCHQKLCFVCSKGQSTPKYGPKNANRLI